MNSLFLLWSHSLWSSTLVLTRPLLVGHPPESFPTQTQGGERNSLLGLTAQSSWGERVVWNTPSGYVGSACWDWDLWGVYTVWSKSCVSPGELGPSHGCFSRAKLHMLLGRCGQWPGPAHTLVAAATPDVETSVTSGPPSLAPTPALQAAKQFILPSLGLQPAVMNCPASGTCASSGVSVSSITDHSQLITPVAPAKAGSCNMWVCGVKGSWIQRSLASLAGPGCSLDSLSCHPSPFRISLWQSTPAHFMEPTPKSWASAPSHISRGEHADKHFTAGKCWSATSSGELSAFQASAAAFLSEVPKLTLAPAPEGVSETTETFPPSQLLPWGTGPCPKVFLSLFSYIFCPILFCRD